MCHYSTRDQKNRTTNFVFSGIQSQVGDCRFTPTVRYWWPISSFRIFKVTLRKLESRNSAPSFQSSKLSGHGKMMRTRNEGQYRHFNSSKFPGQTLQDSSAYINTQRFHIKLSFGGERNSRESETKEKEREREREGGEVRARL